jgi:ABC-2 type transport system permease protein
MIAAILRAQLLSMRIGARRGAVFGAITGVIWYGIWAAVAVAAYVVARTTEAANLERYLPLGFLAVCAYWQLIPVISASMGAGLDMRKMLVYPVPHEKLFLVEILLRLTTGAEMVLVLTGGMIGLFRNPAAGGWTGFPRILLAIVIFILFNLLLASGMRSLLERLLTRRKVREVLSFFLLMLYVVPRMLIQTGSGPKSLGPFRGAFDTVGLPWTAAARAAISDPHESGLLALFSLCGWTILALWFGRLQFERNLRYDAVAAQATPQRPVGSRTLAWTERFYRWPSLLWRDPLAGMVEKELRSLARTPRFRMVFVMGFTFGLMVWFPMIATRHGNSTGQSSQYFLIAVCVYSLTLLGQVSYWNCFGFDRSAAEFYFAAPQPLSQVLLGKNIAAMFFIYVEVLILTGVTVALGFSGGWSLVVETLPVVGVCAVYMLALGNISSVQYPRALSPERVSQGGASGRFQGLIFLLYPLALFPVFLAYLARYAFASEIVFVFVMSIAAIMGGVLYWQAMQSAVRTAYKRREQILRELSKGDGPVTAE